MVKVSILIPLYNGIEFLEECIDSVIQQTFVDLGSFNWNKWTRRRWRRVNEYNSKLFQMVCVHNQKCVHFSVHSDRRFVFLDTNHKLPLI
jgi:hypothetical protein